MFSIFKSQESITVEELNALDRGKIQLIDVRTPQEYQGGRVKEAKNVPLDQIQSFNGNKDEDIYVMCQSGGRSSQAVKYLSKQGYKAINVDGGMNLWAGKVQGGK